MIEAAIFDIDGTLVDSVDLQARAWQVAFAKFGYEIPYTRILQQIGKGGDKLIASLLPPDDLPRVQADLEGYRAALFQREFLPKVRPFPQVPELFERLASDGIRTVLASSGKRAEVDFLTRRSGIEPWIVGAVSADDAQATKPAPDIFHAALELIPNVLPEDVIVVGDTTYDIAAARQAGLRAVGLLSGPFDAAALRRSGASDLFEDPGDLLGRYEAWTGRHAPEEEPTRVRVHDQSASHL